jgi:hemerythrin-like domain-containing protein
MKITEALLAEHVVYHNFFDYIEQSAPKLTTAAEIRSLACLMEWMLTAHSHAEEDLLFAPLEHYLEQIGQNDTFHKEHIEIDQSLKDAQAATRVDQARQLLLSAVIASRKHFDKEERIIFPLADRVFKASTLLELGRAWRRQREIDPRTEQRPRAAVQRV